MAFGKIPPPIDLLSLKEFERGEGVDHQVGRESYEQKVDLRHEQPHAEDGHEAAVNGPQLHDDVTRELGVRKVLGLLVLYGVEEKGRERVAEEVVEARAREAGHRHHEPPIPCVDGERHDFGGG